MPLLLFFCSLFLFSRLLFYPCFFFSFCLFSYRFFFCSFFVHRLSLLWTPRLSRGFRYTMIRTPAKSRGSYVFVREIISASAFRFHHQPIRFAFSVGYGSAVPRGCQRTQNHHGIYPSKNFKRRAMKLPYPPLIICKWILILSVRSDTKIASTS